MQKNIFEYTKNNHLKISYEDDFKIEFGKVKTHNTFRQECINVAKELYDIHGNKLDLLLSGGIDSEIMFLSFIAAGIIPRVTIIRYERNLNMHDINYAFRLCARYGVSPEVYDINAEMFFKNQCVETAFRTKCNSPQLNLLAYCLSKINGVPVLGMGENHLSRKYVSDNKYSLEVFDVEQEKETRLITYFQDNKKEIIPAFFQYTPELMVSFLQKESMYRWVETAKKNRYLNINKVKWQIAIEDFDLEPRPKLTGFELFSELDEDYRTRINNYPNKIKFTEFTNYIKKFDVPLLREIKYEQN